MTKMTESIFELKKTKNPLWTHYDILYGESLAEKNWHTALLLTEFATENIDIHCAIDFALHDGLKPFDTHTSEGRFVLEVQALQTILQAISYEKQYELDLTDVIVEQEKMITSPHLISYVAKFLIKRTNT